MRHKHVNELNKTFKLFFLVVDWASSELVEELKVNQERIEVSEYKEHVAQEKTSVLDELLDEGEHANELDPKECCDSYHGQGQEDTSLRTGLDPNLFRMLITRIRTHAFPAELESALRTDDWLAASILRYVGPALRTRFREYNFHHFDQDFTERRASTIYPAASLKGC